MFAYSIGAQNMLWTASDMIALTFFLNLPLCSCARKEYFVYPTAVEERSTTSNLVLRLNEDITLNLEKSEVLAESLIFVTATREGHEIETVNTSSIQEKLHHDLNERSSLLVQQIDGALHVEGIVNRNLRIKPIPEGERSAQGHMLHSLYEVQEIGEELAKMGAHSRYYPQTHARTQSAYRSPQVVYPGIHHVFQTTTSTTTTRRPVSTFVVEVHIISDEAHSEHFQSKMDLITYLGIMLNAVGLRYLEMTMPAIKFKLVGVTMSKADVFASLIVGTLEAYETLDKLEQYYKEGNIPGNPDLIYLITNRDMSSIKTGSLEKGIAGLANVAGVCTNRRVAMGEDVALSYQGVFAMAHEVAHLLGARHDPMVSNQCPWKAGFLMSYEDGGTNKYRLSSCSMASIRATVARLPFICVLERASVTVLSLPNPGVMPGQKISPDKHCELIKRRELRIRRIRSTAYAAMPPDLAIVCKMKCCYNVRTQTWCQTVDLAEGMVCTGNQTCRKGVCGNHT
ncbi:venom metalloproteinase antarease-like TtrivMP_A isoform X2 [Dermacentor variabilis]|uniref:venom metalloproteinase antarease-like TtrivMP_A isoform X2 n=1 Tax=Dermacentor variabilis TaxID=34621 RepID=UPI003F5C2C49